MPNYNITVNSNFNPFSFERYMQPDMMYTQAYNEIEDAYSQLQDETSMWEEAINRETNPYVRNLYTTYMNRLKDSADKLATQGLDKQSRKAMIDLKSQFKRYIEPIKTAYNKREELSAEQRKLRAQDDSLIYDTDYSTASLYDLIQNPSASYRTISRDRVTKRVADAASNLAREVRENPRTWRDILGKQYFESIEKNGYSTEAILNAIQNSKNAEPALRKILDDAIKSTGVRSWNNNDALKAVTEAANQGLWNAIGKTEYTTLQNRNPDNTGNGGNEINLGSVYTTFPNAKLKDKNYNKFKSQLEFLDKIIKDPSLLENTYKTYNTYMYNPTAGGGFNANPVQTYENTYLNDLLKLAEEYKFEDLLGDLNITLNTTTNPDGITTTSSNIDDAIQRLYGQIEKELKYNADKTNLYGLNMTDKTGMQEYLKDRILMASLKNKTYTGLTDFSDGINKDKSITKSQLSDYLTEDANILFDPNVGLILTNGEKSAVINPEILDENGAEGVLYDAVKRAIETPDASVIDSLMKILYKTINDRSKVQGKTTSKDLVD